MEKTDEQLPISERADHVARSLAAAGVAVCVAGAAAVWYFDPSSSNFFPVCPLYSLTGYACPGCGLTRGFHALFHGDILTALDYNALIPMFAGFLGYLFLSMFLVAVRGRGLTMGKMNGPLLWMVFGLLLVFGVARNIPAYPFSILFP
ncbi:MAG: DUF2752 domain-containing protein [Pyrinomonadaceae bacterium]